MTCTNQGVDCTGLVQYEYASVFYQKMSFYGEVRHMFHKRLES